MVLGLGLRLVVEGKQRAWLDRIAMGRVDLFGFDFKVYCTSRHDTSSII